MLKNEIKEIVKKLLAKYVTKTKRIILKILFEKDETLTVKTLEEITSFSQPLIAFHLNGNVNNIDSLCYYKLTKRVTNRRGVLVGYKITDTGKRLIRFLEGED